MTNRAERIEKIKREKRNLYLLAAVKTFQEKGFNNTQIKEITNLAGTSVGNFYRYFKSKDEIFEVIIEEFYNSIIKELKTLQSKDAPSLKMIKNFIHRLLKNFKQKSNVALIYIEQMHGINQKYSKLRDKYQTEGVQEISKIIKKLMELNIIRKQNVEITSILWMEGVFQVFSWLAKHNFEIPEDDIIDNLANFLFSGTIGK